MTKTFSLSTLALSAFTSEAIAGGDHAGNAAQVILHMLSEPDHLAMLSLVAVGCFAIYRMARRSA